MHREGIATARLSAYFRISDQRSFRGAGDPPPFLAFTKYRGQAGQSLFYPADDWTTDFNHAVREWFIGMRSAVNIQRAADF